MSWLFGKKKTPAELLRENKRMIDRAIRDLDRERTALQAQEKKSVMEIKKMAKEGQMEAVKVMAKSVVRNRAAVTKLYGLKSQLQAVSLRMAELKSTQAMSDAMRGTTRAMAAMNRQMQLPALAKIMHDFQRQNMMMENVSEAMGDSMDMAFEGADEEEESDVLVSQVLDEIGVDTTAKLAAVPTAAGLQAVPAAPQPQQAVAAMGAAGGHGSSSGRQNGGGPPPAGGGAGDGGDGGGGGGGMAEPASDDILARLQKLRATS